jgi:hypothetical protein
MITSPFAQLRCNNFSCSLFFLRLDVFIRTRSLFFALLLCGNVACSPTILSTHSGIAIPSRVELDVSEWDGEAKIVTFDIPITNRTNRAVRFVGMRSDCNCTEAELPSIVIPSRTLSLKVHWGLGAVGSPGIVAKEVLFVHEHSDRAISVVLMVNILEDRS